MTFLSKCEMTTVFRMPMKNVWYWLRKSRNLLMIKPNLLIGLPEMILKSLNMELTVLLYQNGYPPEWTKRF